MAFHLILQKTQVLIVQKKTTCQQPSSNAIRQKEAHSRVVQSSPHICAAHLPMGIIRNNGFKPGYQSNLLLCEIDEAKAPRAYSTRKDPFLL